MSKKDKTPKKAREMLQAVGLLFDPSHPHCSSCRGHMDLDKPGVVVQLQHPKHPQIRVLAILCNECAQRDPDVLKQVIDSPAFHVEHQA